MKKTFEFKYYQNDYDEENEQDDWYPHPINSELQAEFTFNSGCTWDVILWQFCKFLEATGYQGVTERVRLVDKLDIMAHNHLFQCIDDDVWGDDDDTEEDEEETDQEEEVNFQDIKKEIA